MRATMRRGVTFRPYIPCGLRAPYIEWRGLTVKTAFLLRPLSIRPSHRGGCEREMLCRGPKGVPHTSHRNCNHHHEWNVITQDVVALARFLDNQATHVKRTPFEYGYAIARARLATQSYMRGICSRAFCRVALSCSPGAITYIAYMLIRSGCRPRRVDYWKWLVPRTHRYASGEGANSRISRARYGDMVQVMPRGTKCILLYYSHILAKYVFKETINGWVSFQNDICKILFNIQYKL